jgi:diguanylate cyclase (GGDEF)-like protein
MQVFVPTIAVQFDLLGNALGVAVAVVVSFAVITITASFFRFQRIVKVAESAQPEEMGATASDILRVQIARYLATCARKGTSFSLSFVHVENPAVEVRLDSPFVTAIKQSARRDDLTCFFDAQTAALLTETEPDDSAGILRRAMDNIVQNCPEVSIDQLRAGVASYPGHGLSGIELIEAAQTGLAQTDPDNPIVMPEIVEIEDEDDEEDLDEAAETEEQDVEPEDEELEEEGAGSEGRKRRTKSSVVDELTGVLKPSAVSAYMQRMMSDLRRTRKNVALFCVGVNNIEHITRIHGEQAANDILVAVSNILQDNIRADDLIGRHEKYAFLVLAEASLKDASIIGKRISTLVHQAVIPSDGKKLKTTVTLGVATYPEHGRNLHQLYVAGQKVLDYGRENDIRAYAVYDPKIHDKVPSKPLKNIKSIKA